MSRLTFVAVGAAVALMAASAAPAQATPRTAATVLKADSPAAGIQNVHDRNRWSNRRRDQDRNNFSFGFGFGAPLVYYPSRTYRTYDCPYGYWYDPGYGCVTNRHYSYPRYYRSEPGVSLEFRF